MKLIYVCSPYSGDINKNVENARNYSRYVANVGFLPITPHLLYPQFLNDNIPSERVLGMMFGNELLSKCDELWVFGTTRSSGMKAEIEYATMLQIPVKFIGGDI